MNKKFCDRCNNEIKKSFFRRTKYININNYEDFEICDKCYRDFKEWINN